MGCSISQCGGKFAGSETVDALSGATDITVRTWEPEQKIGDNTAEGAAANQRAWTPVIVYHGRLLDQPHDKSDGTRPRLGPQGDLRETGGNCWSPQPAEGVATEVKTDENCIPQLTGNTATEEHGVHLEGANVSLVTSDAAETVILCEGHALALQGGNGSVSGASLISSTAIDIQIKPGPDGTLLSQKNNGVEQRSTGSFNTNCEGQNITKETITASDRMGDVLSSLPKDIHPVLAHETIWKVLSGAASLRWKQIMHKEFDTYGQQWVEYKATNFASEKTNANPLANSTSYRLPLYGLDAASSEMLQGFVNFVNRMEGSDIFGVRWVKLNFNDHRWGLNEAEIRPHASSSTHATNPLSEEESRSGNKDYDNERLKDCQWIPAEVLEGVQASPTSGTSTTGTPRPLAQDSATSSVRNSVSTPDNRKLGSVLSSGSTPLPATQQPEVHGKYSENPMGIIGRRRPITQESPTSPSHAAAPTTDKNKWSLISSIPPRPLPQESLVTITVHPGVLSTDSSNRWSFSSSGPPILTPQHDVQGIPPASHMAVKPKSTSKDFVSGSVFDFSPKPPGYIGPPPVVFGGNAAPLEVEQVPKKRINLMPPFTQSRPRGESPFPASYRHTPQSLTTGRLLAGPSSYSMSSQKGGGARPSSASNAAASGHKFDACRNMDHMGILFWGPRSTNSRLTL